MNKKKVLISVLIGFAAVLFFAVTIILILPNEFVEGLLKDTLKKNLSLTFTGEGFKKVFPFGFEVDRVTFSPVNRNKEGLYFDRVKGSLNPMGILLGRVSVTLEGKIGKGKVRCVVVLEDKRTRVKIGMEDLEVAAVSYLSSLGLKGTGILNGEGEFVLPEKGCPHGTMNVGGKDVDLKRLKFAGPFLLLGEKVRFTLASDARDCRIRIKSLWVEGEDVSVKLSGDIFPAQRLLESGLSLSVEILPEKDSIDKSALLPLLSRYKKSLNYYLLHIKGTIERPLFVQ